MNIYQRINQVRKEVGYVKKEANVQGYKAVTHDDVTAALRKALINAGIVVTQTLSKSETSTVGATKSGAVQRMFDAIFDVSFINIDEPKDRLTISVPAQAIDTSDKATGKAMSYAMKYAMLKTFNLETGENEESKQEVFERKSQEAEKVNNEQIEMIMRLAEKTATEIDDLIGFYKVDRIESLNQVQRADIIVKLKAKAEKKAEKGQ